MKLVLDLNNISKLIFYPTIIHRFSTLKAYQLIVFMENPYLFWESFTHFRAKMHSCWDRFYIVFQVWVNNFAYEIGSGKIISLESSLVMWEFSLRTWSLACCLRLYFVILKAHTRFLCLIYSPLILYGIVVSVSGYRSRIQISRFRVRTLADFLRSSGFGTGCTQPNEDNWVTTWIKSSGSGIEHLDKRPFGPDALTTRHLLYLQKVSTNFPGQRWQLSRYSQLTD
jgi:hypothetical protein